MATPDHATNANHAWGLLAAASAGWVYAVLAWAMYSSPSVALLLPLIWLSIPARAGAGLFVATYVAGVTRVLPAYAGGWFDSFALGLALWVAMAALCGLFWAALWPRQGAGKGHVATAAIGATLGALLPPVALVMPGHPVAALGYLIEGGGWVALLAYFCVIGWAATELRGLAEGNVLRWTRGLAQPAVILVATGALWVVGAKLDGSDQTRGRLVGKWGAVRTEFGPPPVNDDQAVDRIARIGRMVRSLAGGEDGLDVVVLPETILGVAEPGNLAVLRSEVLVGARAAKQTVVLGAVEPQGAGRFANLAMGFRPDGSTWKVAARQSVPVASWAPWSGHEHYPSDWLGPATAEVTPGVRARFMMCYEEWMPILHLMPEVIERQNLVIAMANRWSTSSPLASAIQSAHTEGMAKLFRRPWLRSENLPAAGGKPRQYG